jgi:hypothetical protein
MRKLPATGPGRLWIAGVKMTVESATFSQIDDCSVKTFRPYPIGNRSRFLAYSLYICAALAGGLWISRAAADDRQAYEVMGFRDAHFGMTEQELRAAVVKDFSLKPADITSAVNSVEGTTVLTAKVASLEPGPGPAAIAYILGHTSKKLIQINVVWGEQKAAASDTNTMVAAGERLARYFAGYAWNRDSTGAGVPVGPNTLALFSGEDSKSGAVRLILDGIKYQMQKDGKDATSPDPKGPPRILINYIANRDNPDVATIPKGQF